MRQAVTAQDPPVNSDVFRSRLMPTTDRHLYADPAYVAALGEDEAARDLAPWGTALRVRAIPGSGGQDAAGPYPLTVLKESADLEAGLSELRADGLVSVVVAPDPLTAPPRARLEAAFHHVRDFKAHYLVDPAAGAFAPSKHHRDRIRRASRRCVVGIEPLAERLDDWRRLYAGLVERRSVTGPADFGEAYFALLAERPEITAFVARTEAGVVGMTLWFAHAGVAYNHLLAADADGYAAGASYALYEAAITHHADCVINLGGGAGTGDGAGGLADFKRGFANSEVTALICGTVLDEARYGALSDAETTDFFPAYRAPRT